MSRNKLMEGAEKYSLRPRSIAKRLEVEQKLKQHVQQQVKRVPKPKQKPAPLSKYRRKTANARERSRMKEINQAFETLRKAIPQESLTYHSDSPSPSSGSSSCGSNQSSSEKWTKITTLRLAMDYIEALTRVLERDPNNFDSLMDEFSPAGLILGAMNHHHHHSTTSLSDSGSCDLSASDNLLSDDLDSFDDCIPMNCVPDVGMAAFDIFLESDGDSLHFHSELSDPNTP